MEIKEKPSVGKTLGLNETSESIGSNVGVASGSIIPPGEVLEMDLNRMNSRCFLRRCISPDSPSQESTGGIQNG